MNMKRFFLLAAALVAMMACNSNKDEWKLVWSDEFDGEQIDEATWTRVPTGKDDWDDMMSLREDLAYVENGELVLMGKVNDGTAPDNGRPFVTAGIISKGKKAFQLARFEVRAKFSSANGFWPAIWLSGPCPDYGTEEYAEIDMMEHLNYDDYIFHTVHSKHAAIIHDNPLRGTTVPIKRDDWNIYAAEVYQDSVCFYVNDAKTLTYPRVEGLEYQFPYPEKEMHIRLSNQLGGGWVGPVSYPEQLPTELRIDYVRVYQKAQ